MTKTQTNTSKLGAADLFVRICATYRQFWMILGEMVYRVFNILYLRLFWLQVHVREFFYRSKAFVCQYLHK